MTATPQTLTQLLSAWSEGDKAALEQLMPMVYQELRRLAGHHLAHERLGQDHSSPPPAPDSSAAPSAVKLTHQVSPTSH